MKTSSCLSLLLVAILSTGTSAKTTSLRGKRQVNLPFQTETGTELQGLIDAILVETEEQQQQEEPTMDESNTMYTIDDLELAEASARDFVESKGRPVSENDSSKYTVDDLEIAEESAKSFLESKGKRIVHKRMYTDEALDAAATSAERFVASKRPQLRSRQAKEPSRIAKTNLKSSEVEAAA